MLTVSTPLLSQTVVDLHNPARNAPDLTLSLDQQKLQTDSTINVSASRNGIRTGMLPLVNLSGSVYSSVGCPEQSDGNCTHRVQFNTYSDGTLFQDSADELLSDNRNVSLDSWVVGVSINENSVHSSSSIIRLAFETYNQAEVCWSCTIVARHKISCLCTQKKHVLAWSLSSYLITPSWIYKFELFFFLEEKKVVETKLMNPMKHLPLPYASLVTGKKQARTTKCLCKVFSVCLL